MSAVKSAVVIVCLATVTFMSGCDILDNVDRIKEETLYELDKAINLLSQDMASWQFVLQDLQGKFTHDLQQTIRGEVSQLLKKGIGAAGSEVLCVVDSVPRRMLRGLEVIKVRYLNQNPPPLEPTICQTSMDVLDLNLEPLQRKEIVYYGYDVVESSGLEAVLRKTSGEEYPLSNRLNRQTGYQFTVNLAGLDDGILVDHLLLAVKLEKQDLSQIAIQPKIKRPPKTREDWASIAPITYVPPHTNGDRDFDGNGPNVRVNAFLFMRPDHLYLRVYMKVSEDAPDWTTAEGWSAEHRFYNAPPGWHIKSIGGKTAWNPLVKYTDVNIEPDRFNTDLGQVIIVGDTDGDEAGTLTRVDIARFIYRVPVLLEENVPGLVAFSPDEHIQLMKAQF